MIDPQFRAELNERLFTCYIGGRWTAPLGTRAVPVHPFDGGRMGTIACAEQGDIARAVAGLRGPPPERAALEEAYAGSAYLLRALRREEGYADAVARPVMPATLPPGDGPLIVLSAAATALARIVGVLIAGAGRGVIWKPAPRAAASAHLLMRALGPVSGTRLAMVQGDHATGALLAGQGGLVWLSRAPCPLVVNDPATAPLRQ